jgi:hypothetical protein
MTGISGVGDMGLPMCGRILARDFDAIAYDLDRGRLSAQLRHLPGAERRPRLPPTGQATGWSRR